MNEVDERWPQKHTVYTDIKIAAEFTTNVRENKCFTESQIDFWYIWLITSTVG